MSWNGVRGSEFATSVGNSKIIDKLVLRYKISGEEFQKQVE